MVDSNIINIRIKCLLNFSFSGSIDGNNQLVIKGRFQQKQIENVLRRYISKLGIDYSFASTCLSFSRTAPQSQPLPFVSGPHPSLCLISAEEYVTCHTCRSPDTILQKDTRLYFLQCETCHSRCSVASIKTGFQAVTGKRAQLRAKAN